MSESEYPFIHLGVGQIKLPNWASSEYRNQQVYLDHQDKVLASVGIPRRSADTYGETVRTMREKKLTFAEAIASPEFMLVQKSRLHIVRRELFEQLEKTPFA